MAPHPLLNAHLSPAPALSNKTIHPQGAFATAHKAFAAVALTSVPHYGSVSNPGGSAPSASGDDTGARMLSVLACCLASGAPRLLHSMLLQQQQQHPEEHRTWRRSLHACMLQAMSCRTSRVWCSVACMPASHPHALPGYLLVLYWVQ